MSYLERTVLRNRVNRKDAAYVVTVRYGDPNVQGSAKFQAVSHYGPWSGYLLDPENLTGLREGKFQGSWTLAQAKSWALGMAETKKARGYSVSHSILGNQPEPSQRLQAERLPNLAVKPDPEPVSIPKQRWADESMVSRLLKRAELTGKE